ncbi:MAG: calcium-binding protein [Arenibacterium sp.]
MALQITFSVAENTQSVDWDSINLAQLVNQPVTAETLTSSAFKGFFPEGEVVFPLTNPDGFATLTGPFPAKLDIAQGIDPQAINDWVRDARAVKLQTAFFNNVDNQFIDIKFNDVEISLERFAGLTLSELMEESIGLAPSRIPGMTDNVITLSDGINNFTASSGDDLVEGGKSNDIIFLGEGSDGANGNAGDDTITGGSEFDSVSGGLGDDVVNGLGGADTLYGDEGADSILGGGGGDLVFGGSGNDEIEGGAGNDDIRGNGGKDVIDGGNGNDEIFGDAGNDRISGGKGFDLIEGGTGDDVIRGGAGEDKLIGGANNDKIFGGKESDDLVGNAGRDRLIGNGGDDTLDGGGGRDVLKGGTGKDLLLSSNGNDRFFGGDDADEFLFSSNNKGRDVIKGYAVSQDKTLFTEAGKETLTSVMELREYVENNTVFNSRGAEVTFLGGKVVIYEDIQSSQQTEFFATFEILL